KYPRLPRDRPGLRPWRASPLNGARRPPSSLPPTARVPVSSSSAVEMGRSRPPRRRRCRPRWRGGAGGPGSPRAPPPDPPLGPPSGPGGGPSGPLGERLPSDVADKGLRLASSLAYADDSVALVEAITGPGAAAAAGPPPAPPPPSPERSLETAPS